MATSFYPLYPSSITSAAYVFTDPPPVPTYASKMWVTNATGDSVSKIDIGTFTVDAEISVGDNPWGLCYVPRGGADDEVWVFTSGDTNVTILNAQTNEIKRTLSTDSSIFYAISDGTSVWSSRAHTTGRVYKWNVAARTSGSPIAVGGGARGMDFDGLGNIWVACATADDCRRFSMATSTVDWITNVGDTPYDVKLFGLNMTTTNFNDDTLSNIYKYTGTVTSTPSAGDRPYHSTVVDFGDYQRLWVGNYLGEDVDEFTGSFVSKTVDVGRNPLGMWNDGTYVYVVGSLENEVIKIRANDGQEIGRVDVGNSPKMIAGGTYQVYKDETETHFNNFHWEPIDGAGAWDGTKWNSVDTGGGHVINLRPTSNWANSYRPYTAKVWHDAVEPDFGNVGAIYNDSGVVGTIDKNSGVAFDLVYPGSVDMNRLNMVSDDPGVFSITNITFTEWVPA